MHEIIFPRHTVCTSTSVGCDHAAVTGPGMERPVVLSDSCPFGTGGKLIWPGDLSAILGTSSSH